MVAPVFEGQNGHLPMLCNHGSFTMVWKTPAYIAMVPYYTLQLPGLNAPEPDPPLYIPTHGIVAMNQIVASMHAAYNNRKQSGIDLIQLSEHLSAMELGVDETWEAGHLAVHPSSLTGFVDEPMVILGTSDTIALWYLPGAITNDLQASLQTHMLATLDPLHHAMSKNMTSGSWQKNAEYFNHTSWSPGYLEFSLARHQQGHMVWLYYLRASADLQMDASHEWSQQSYLLAAILSSALSIMHPGLYDAGRQAMQSLDTWSSQHNQDMHDALQHWPLDPHSWSDWYDMLVTVGSYEDCVLDIPMLGLQFLYNPGTVVAFSSRLLRHGGYPMGTG
ncbi:hypothetical protein F5J12DRAFT_784451 [Pisolithus orientalis]|uniref:uncharacterized protein n=1 Tax=Pisolithus orientalis TaxID=936130 RepID=UPI0022252A67|nr:uncharacterized protein F5J12DRAFT_784451 [Pisolithus orientalis]KAI6000138.1 hypothetical protein F5J12DRAFT_784451 [Pisolithus orientalis]